MQARILLASILVCRKEELVIKYEEELEKSKEEKFFEGIEKISKGYPIQYITKVREFMNMEFYVDENVLIPRPDTEILVQEVIDIAKKGNKKEILDMCTGSGAIAISLLKYLEDIKVTATDISENALKVAKKNSKNLLQDKKINFMQSDMFEKIDKKFDIIVSNPPYIKTKVIDEYILKYEPNLALDGGKDGLDFYKIIINEGYKYLNKGGVIALEIGYDQREEVIELIKNSGKYRKMLF